LREAIAHFFRSPPLSGALVLSASRKFEVTRYHSLIVERKGLPAEVGGPLHAEPQGAQVLAELKGKRIPRRTRFASLAGDLKAGFAPVCGLRGSGKAHHGGFSTRYALTPRSVAPRLYAGRWRV
jgi:hypothetical protein